MFVAYAATSFDLQHSISFLAFSLLFIAQHDMAYHHGIRQTQPNNTAKVASSSSLDSHKAQ
jgi:hypothetical protein